MIIFLQSIPPIVKDATPGNYAVWSIIPGILLLGLVAIWLERRADRKEAVTLLAKKDAEYRELAERVVAAIAVWSPILAKMDKAGEDHIMLKGSITESHNLLLDIKQIVTDIKNHYAK